jgi:electron transfer flavoprotein alpha subunit
VDGDRIAGVKAVSDQYLYQKVVFLHRGPNVLTMSPHAMVRGSPEINKRAEVITMFPEIDPAANRIRFVEWIKADPRTLGLEEADRIICGGRGVGKQAFALIHQLADALNGSMGGTRPVIDWGVLPYERQIGQTGIEVFPSLLMTFGVSGANEFTVGIEGSKLVIAVNTDQKARIFKFADLGIISDLHKIIPLMIEQIKRYKLHSVPPSPSREEVGTTRNRGLGGGKETE